VYYGGNHRFEREQRAGPAKTSSTHGVACVFWEKLLCGKISLAILKILSTIVRVVRGVFGIVGLNLPTNSVMNAHQSIDERSFLRSNFFSNFRIFSLTKSCYEENNAVCS